MIHLFLNSCDVIVVVDHQVLSIIISTCIDINLLSQDQVIYVEQECNYETKFVIFSF